MNEEIAIRIAEALENVDGAIRIEIVFMIGIAFVFWATVVFKN